LRRHFDRRRFLHLSAGAGLLATFPSLAFGAYGKYEAMLVTCIDLRVPEPTIHYMERRHMVGKYSQFAFAGASIGVVAPAFKTWTPAFWDNLATSMELHSIRQDRLRRRERRQRQDRNRNAQGGADGIPQAGKAAQGRARPDGAQRQSGDV
jgi:hypothetical protein